MQQKVPVLLSSFNVSNIPIAIIILDNHYRSSISIVNINFINNNHIRKKAQSTMIVMVIRNLVMKCSKYFIANNDI